MKSGAWDFHYTASDLCIVVRQALHAVSAQATPRHVQIELQLPDCAPALLDHGQMQMAMIALLENAIRFSPPYAWVVVRVQRDGEHVFVQVTDHGMGIEASILPRIFEEFTPADVAHHTAGHGLSLAIVQQIVQAHQGTISVESVQGVDTTFTVRLPLLESADRSHEAVGLAEVT